MRKEQGRKLKELMQKKREEKNKKLQDELRDLENIISGK
jgi:Spy/CpxP family protein refolding chaperone